MKTGSCRRMSKARSDRVFSSWSFVTVGLEGFLATELRRADVAVPLVEGVCLVEGVWVVVSCARTVWTTL